MHWSNWVVAGLAVIQSGWMAYDGLRALTVGDYVTAKEGPYAGQLGPWSKLVAGLGVDPRSALMKTIFVVYGIVWLVFSVLFIATGASWIEWAMGILAAGALWYLPIGTFLGLLQLVFLIAF